MPDPPTTILKALDFLGPATEEDEVVWDDSAGGVSPSIRIWEAQRHLVIDPTPGFRLVLNHREGVFVHTK